MLKLSTKIKTSILLYCAVIFLSTACSSSGINYRHDVVNHYMPKGWLEYNSAKVDKHSGYQLIQQAHGQDKGLADVFDIYGKPDYVRAASKRRLNLAYLQRGLVLTFRLHSGMAPTVSNYQRFNNLSQSLVKLFKRNIKQRSALDDVLWTLETFDSIAGSQAVIENTHITLSFDMENFQVNGIGGCNHYSADFVLDDVTNKMTISNVISTEMWCEQPKNVMQQEQDYFATLTQIQLFTFDKSRLNMLVGADAGLNFVVAD